MSFPTVQPLNDSYEIGSYFATAIANDVSGATALTTTPDDGARYIVGGYAPTLTVSPQEELWVLASGIGHAIRFALARGVKTDSIGIWKNDSGNYELDFNRHFENRNFALEEAARLKQVAIYDLEEDTEIRV